jgi:acylphosphatase
VPERTILQPRKRRLMVKTTCMLSYAAFSQRISEPGLRIARRYLVSGRVQGVGFRFFAEAAALREGLHGWVRNLPDGRVEALAEGEAEALERFERAIGHGPPGARVERVDVDHIVPSGRESGFTTR